jgi:3-hydroxyacyl-CoA dehydrogenase
MTQRARLAVIGDGKMGHAIASLATDYGFDVVAMLGERQVLPDGITEALLEQMRRWSSRRHNLQLRMCARALPRAAPWCAARPAGIQSA